MSERKNPQKKLQLSSEEFRPSRTPSRPKSPKEEVYHLHIGAVPQPVGFSPKKVVVRNPFESDGGRREVHAVSRTSGSGFLAFVWDKLQFVLVSAVVFLVIFVTLNWQALQINALHYWNVWNGFKSPLETVVNDKPAAPEKLIVATTTVKSVEAIPPLNIEVFPPDMRVVIPRINQNVPVVGVKNDNLIARKWQDLEADIQKSLRDGVIHYPGTALPGENGNIVLTGHSSYYAWDPGRFKDVFALLHDVKQGDKIVVYFNQRKYTYEVFSIKTVLPQNVDVLGTASAEQLTLITCTPIGTNLKRLIVQARLSSKT